MGDAAAQGFAGHLYSSIAFGLPLSTAFGQAALQVRLALGVGFGEPNCSLPNPLRRRPVASTKVVCDGSVTSGPST